MIDIHTHILPGLDDGSPSLENSLEHIKLMVEAGVTDIFVTPHYITGEYNNTPDIIEEKRLLLQKDIDKAGYSCKLHKGVEVYLTDNVHEQLNLREYTLGNSDYILVETAMNGFPVNLLDILYRMVKSGLKPIMAHPERYADVIKSSSKVEDLIYRNVYMQANAGSFLGVYGDAAANTAWELLQKGFIHFIASDCHCSRDEYLLPIAKEMLKENFPDYPLEQFFSTNQSLVLENDSIEYFNPPIYQPAVNKGSILSKILRIFYEG